MPTFQIENISASTQSWMSNTIASGQFFSINYQNLYDDTASIPTFSDASTLSALAQEDKILLVIDGVQKTKEETLAFIADLYNGKIKGEIPNQFLTPLQTQNGFVDYNDTTGSFSITADTWTDLPNNGLGAFTNKAYKPTGVTELMDTSTGYLDVTELDLGDAILIRNDYTITPNTNNCQLRFRYSLGTGAGTYTLEKIIGRLDSGSGQPYRFSLTPDEIYMGDTNTRDNPIKLQIFCSSDATVTNAGSVIQVVKR
jgi:hypothetical protein